MRELVNCIRQEKDIVLVLGCVRLKQRVWLPIRAYWFTVEFRMLPLQTISNVLLQMFQVQVFAQARLDGADQSLSLPDSDFIRYRSSSGERAEVA